MNKKIFFLMLVCLGLFISQSNVLARCSLVHTVTEVYYCASQCDSETEDCSKSNCGSAMKIMRKTITSYGWIHLCPGPDDKPQCDDLVAPPPVESPPQVVATAEEWQTCTGSASRVIEQYRTVCEKTKSYIEYYNPGQSLAGTPPYFHCSGECLDAPEEIRYYNNPYYPQIPSLSVDPTRKEVFDGDYIEPEICEAENLENYPLLKTCIEPSENKNSINLPLKIDWNENSYWQEEDGNCGPFGCKAYAGGAQSYVFTLYIDKKTDDDDPSNDDEAKWVSNPEEIIYKDQNINDYIAKDINKYNQEVSQGYFSTVLNLNNQPSYIEGGEYRSSEYNLKVDHNACWLKSGNTDGFTIKVQTCCNEDGTDCNSGITDTFKTTTAPELKSPEDLDWEGPNWNSWDAWAGDEYEPFDWETQSIPASTNNDSIKLDIPVKLDWCDLSENRLESNLIKSYDLLFYMLRKDLEDEDEDGDTEERMEVCHYSMAEGSKCNNLILAREFDSLETFTVYDETAEVAEGEVKDLLFTSNDYYGWQAKGCTSLLGASCYNYSQIWKFATSSQTIETDDWFYPGDGVTVGYPVEISWGTSGGINSYYYEVYQNGALLYSGQTGVSSLSIKNPELLSRITWRVKPCETYLQDTEEPRCNDWGDTHYFYITGEMPTGLSSQNEEGKAIISWNRVQGAKSYSISISGKDFTVNGASTEIEFNSLSGFSQGDEIEWKVKTCADTDGQYCGEYNSSTFTVPILENPTVEEKEIIYTNESKTLSWNDVEGAEAYEFIYSYKAMANNESSSSCEGYINKENQKITINDSYTPYLSCLGKYEWSVRSCLTSSCSEGYQNDPESSYFFFIQPGDDVSLVMDPALAGTNTGSADSSASLVPCGRSVDSPSTPWNERDQCEFSHIFIILRNIVNFLLWKVVPAILVIMMMVTGVVFYLAHWQGIDPILNTKKTWKYIGVGVLVAFLAWTAIDFILTFFGYNVGLFGEWWNF